MKSCVVSQPYIRLCCTFWFIKIELIHITDRQEWCVLCVLCTASNQLHCCYTHTSITATINALFTVNEKYIYTYNQTATKLMWYHILFHGIIIQNSRCNTWNIWSLLRPIFSTVHLGLLSISNLTVSTTMCIEGRLVYGQKSTVYTH